MGWVLHVVNVRVLPVSHCTDFLILVVFVIVIVVVVGVIVVVVVVVVAIVFFNFVVVVAAAVVVVRRSTRMMNVYPIIRSFFPNCISSKTIDQRMLVTSTGVAGCRQ